MRICLHCQHISQKEFFRCPKCNELNPTVLGNRETQKSVSVMIMERNAVKAIISNLTSRLKFSSSKGSNKSIGFEVKETNSGARCASCSIGTMIAHVTKGVRTHSTCNRCRRFTLNKSVDMFSKGFSLPLRLCPAVCGGAMFHTGQIYPDEKLLKCEGCGLTIVYNITSKEHYVMKKSNSKERYATLHTEEETGRFNSTLTAPKSPPPLSTKPMPVPAKDDAFFPELYSSKPELYSAEQEDIGHGMSAPKTRECRKCGGVMFIYHISEGTKEVAVTYRCKTCLSNFRYPVLTVTNADATKSTTVGRISGEIDKETREDIVTPSSRHMRPLKMVK